MKSFPLDQEQLANLVTPAYVYDEKSIIKKTEQIKKCFSWEPNFMGYFLMSATPNPRIVDIIESQGFGVVCSSHYELLMAQHLGLHGDQIVFSSVNTPLAEFQKAKELGAIISLDDPIFIEDLLLLGDIPKSIMLRYNPGDVPGMAMGSDSLSESKAGFTREQIISAFKRLQSLGVEEFGIETLLHDDSLSAPHFINMTQNIFELAIQLKRTIGVEIARIHLAGGLDVPYREGEEPLNLKALAGDVKKLYNKTLVEEGLTQVKLSFRAGRYITASAGWLLSRVRTVTTRHKRFIGVDASMAQFIRPALLGANHQISAVDERDDNSKFDIVGAIDRSQDKFAVNRNFPKPIKGDIIAIHDAGAYGFALSNNYCGKMKPAEYLITSDGELEMIRRAETADDLFTTLRFDGAKIKI